MSATGIVVRESTRLRFGIPNSVSQITAVTSPDAALRFREVQEAYEVLSDPERRKTFDDYRQRSLIEDPVPVARDIAKKYFQEAIH